MCVLFFLLNLITCVLSECALRHTETQSEQNDLSPPVSFFYLLTLVVVSQESKTTWQGR